MAISTPNGKRSRSSQGCLTSTPQAICIQAGYLNRHVSSTKRKKIKKTLFTYWAEICEGCLVPRLLAPISEVNRPSRTIQPTSVECVSFNALYSEELQGSTCKNLESFSIPGILFRTHGCLRRRPSLQTNATIILNTFRHPLQTLNTLPHPLQTLEHQGL